MLSMSRSILVDLSHAVDGEGSQYPELPAPYHRYEEGTDLAGLPLGKIACQYACQFICVIVSGAPHDPP